MTADTKPVGHGLYWEEFPIGYKFYTFARTITEADLVGFINVTGFNEVLFTDTEYLKTGFLIKGRGGPAMLIYAISEGLLVPIMQGTGLAFFNATLDVKGPTFVNGTVHVEGEVIESRRTSKGHNGVVRTLNKVINQHGNTVLTYNPLRLIKGRETKR